jgi:hypothetical protein
MELKLRGRFLFDETEHGLETQEISCGGATIDSASPPPINGSIICYIDGLGRVTARVVRHVEHGFCVEFHTGTHKRAKLADQLIRLMNGEARPIAEDGTDTPSLAASATRVTRSDGSQIQAWVTDISLTGAAFNAACAPLKIGETVTVGRLKGDIVRASPEGFAIRFIHMATFELDAA